MKDLNDVTHENINEDNKATDKQEYSIDEQIDILAEIIVNNILQALYANK